MRERLQVGFMNLPQGCGIKSVAGSIRFFTWWSWRGIPHGPLLSGSLSFRKIQIWYCIVQYGHAQARPGSTQSTMKAESSACDASGQQAVAAAERRRRPNENRIPSIENITSHLPTCCTCQCLAPACTIRASILGFRLTCSFRHRLSAANQGFHGPIMGCSPRVVPRLTGRGCCPHAGATSYSGVSLHYSRLSWLIDAIEFRQRAKLPVINC